MSIEELIKNEPYKSCYEYGEQQGKSERRYLIKEDGSIHNLDEDIERAYQQGRADAECEYTSKVFERLREVDADYISIDHLIEVLEWAKEQLKEQKK